MTDALICVNLGLFLPCDRAFARFLCQLVHALSVFVGESERKNHLRHGRGEIRLTGRDHAGENVRLAGRYGPRSLHIHCVQGPVDGWYSIVASFDAEKVLTWLRKQRDEQ